MEVQETNESRHMIRKVEEREIRNERTIMMFDITDFTDTITVKIFVRNEQLPENKL